MQAIIDRFENDKAVLRVTSATAGQAGQELIIPRSELPNDAKEGSVIMLLASTSKTEEEAREKLAKTILNEILNDNSK